MGFKGGATCPNGCSGPIVAAEGPLYLSDGSGEAWPAVKLGVRFQ